MAYGSGASQAGLCGFVAASLCYMACAARCRGADVFDEDVSNYVALRPDRDSFLGCYTPSKRPIGTRTDFAKRSRISEFPAPARHRGALGFLRRRMSSSRPSSRCATVQNSSSSTAGPAGDQAEIPRAGAVGHMENAAMRWKFRRSIRATSIRGRSIAH